MSEVVVVTGSRHGDAYSEIRDLRCQSFLQVHVGDCPSGVDAEVLEWFPDAIVHRADWDREGRAAGPLRNQRMLAAAREAADELNAGMSVRAFPLQARRDSSRGTWNCVELAVILGLQVVVRPVKKLSAR